LGLRLGLDGFFPWNTAEEYINTRLSSLNLNIEKLRAMGGVTVQQGKPYLEDYEAENASPFATASKKIELYSEALAQAGLPALPSYEPVAEAPAGMLRLVYGRSPVHTFAKTQNTPVLSEVMPENALWINADVVASLGFKNGEMVWLENQDGARSGPVQVMATQRIRQDVVYMVHGFGHDAPGMQRAHKRGASDTALQTHYALDPVSGGAGMRVNFVKLVKEA
jgi:thiosulfate reductase/polysulfide reductase chain A